MPYNRPDSATTCVSLPQGLNRLVIQVAKEQGMTKSDVITACIQFCLVEKRDEIPPAPATAFRNRLMSQS